MKLKNMFKKTRRNESVQHKHDRQPEVPDGLLRKCNVCKEAIFTEEVQNNDGICPKCGNYFRIPAYQRIDMTVDSESFEEWDANLVGNNPLHYAGYTEKQRMLQEKTELKEAVITGKAKIGGAETVIGVCDGRFMMASMGQAVGEKITRAFERATEERLPVILFTCSGGARMQEGILSLMQMAKTSAAIKKHSDAGLLYVAVLTNPTTGGVTASFAMEGDITLAEPGALIGFAGPRVIEQTIRQKLPDGFQRSEFLQEHGFVDAIVERKEIKKYLTRILQLHINKKTYEEDCNTYLADGSHATSELWGNGTEKSDAEKSAWERVQISRAKDRPSGSDYIRELFTDFTEQRGDRCYGDDRAIIGGIARFHGISVTVIAQEKGRTTKENIEHNFGMSSPEGYRKALRLMKQAEKFHRPVICFVDTPGAFCGLEAEERGQGEAIARNLYEMSALKVPILSVVIGEGGSGGALALAVADEVWMLENSVYSVLSPEGFASILWKDSKRAEEAAGVMKLTAADLKKLDVVEQVIPEPEPFNIDTLSEVTERMDRKMFDFLSEKLEKTDSELVEERYERFRRM